VPRVGRGLGPRGVLALGASAALIATFSGCFVIKNQTSEQLDVIGDVRLTTVACLSGRTDCGDNGNSGRGTGAPNPYDGLIGYRIPEDAEIESITVTEQSPGPAPLTVEPAPSYAAELERLEPAPDGQQWVGYRTPNLISTAGAELTYVADVSLTQTGDEPFDGPFLYRVVTGATGDDPVVCGDSLYVKTGDPAPICVDSPSEAVTETNLEQETRDLALSATPPSEELVAEEMDLAFLARFRGTPSAATEFTLAATTDIPGGSVLINSEFSPAEDSDTALVVHLTTAEEPPPGEYEVELTASLPGGESRSAAKTLTMPDEVAPRTTITGGPRKTDRPKAKFRFKANERATFECKLDGGGWKRCRSPKTYRNLKPGGHRFSVRATDEAGNLDRSPAKRRFRVTKR
jgi:hypothetical protein